MTQFKTISTKSIIQNKSEIIERLINVLRINLCVVNSEGQILFMPQGDDFGLKFLTRFQEGIFLPDTHIDQWIHNLENDGSFQRMRNVYEVYTYVITLSHNSENLFLVVGPIILNKKLEKHEYQRRAKRNLHKYSELMEMLNEVRVISHNQIHKVLELLICIFKDDLNRQNTSLNIINKHIDDVLKPLLDLSLAVTQAESGSVLGFDKETNELGLLHSTGIDYKNIQNVRLKLGEGLAGLVAKEKSSILINEGTEDKKIKSLLKRPEIKEALVVPVTSSKGELFGVLNIHTKKENSYLAENSKNLLKNIEEICRLAGKNLTA